MKRPARGGPDHAESALTRRDNRDTFRDAVFLWTIPFCALRMISGWASARAFDAASASPLAIASSTLRIWLRMRVRRFLLMAVLREIFRIAFFAEGVFAMSMDPLVCDPTPYRPAGPKVRGRRAHADGCRDGLPRRLIATVAAGVNCRDGAGLPDYLFLNWALRLSMNARMPSF